MEYEKIDISDKGLIKIEIEKQEYYAKLDSGADINIMSGKVFEQLPQHLRNKIDKSVTTRAHIADQSVVQTIGVVKLQVLIGRQLFKIPFHILPNASFPIFLGKPFHKATRAKVDHAENSIKITGSCGTYAEVAFTIDPYREVWCYAKVLDSATEGLVGLVTHTPSVNEKGIMVSNAAVMVRDGGVPMRLYNATNQPIKVNRGEKIGSFREFDQDEYCLPIDFKKLHNEGTEEASEKLKDLNAIIEEDKKYDPQFDFSRSKLNKEQLGKLKRLLKRYHMCFVDPKNPKLGLTNVMTAKIETFPGAVPVCKYPYRIAPVHRKIMNEIVDNHVKLGILEECSSGGWASPALLVEKPGKNGHRLVCDFRELNKVTIPMVMRVPRIDDVIDTVGAAKPKYFSVLDLTHGFHQIPLDEESKEKTSFILNDRGKLRHRTLSQGLKNATAIFQYMMDTVLKGIQFEYVLSYVDDVIIYSRTFEEHLSHIEQVLIRMKEANLKFSPMKCQFAVEQVKFLGHILTERGIEPNDDKLEVVKSYPTPKTVKQVRGFLGVTGYYRRFVEKYAEKARPLYYLTKKNVPFEWTEECEKSFQTLKEALLSDKILAYPDFSKKFILATDASNTGVGACLSQEQDGEIRPIGYAGRGFTSAEKNYHTTDKELLAVVFGVQYFRVYLAGNEFDIHTDHAGLRQILTTKNLEGRQARWVTFLQGYNFTPYHIKGVNNVIPDCLSRRPYEITHTEADDKIDKYPEIMAITESPDDHPGHSVTPKCRLKSVSFAPMEVKLMSSINDDTSSGDDAHFGDHFHYTNEERITIKYQRFQTHTKGNAMTPPVFHGDIDKLSEVKRSDEAPAVHVDAVTRSKANKQHGGIIRQVQAEVNEVLEDLDLSVERIKAGQSKDPQIKLIYNYLKHGRLPRNNDQAKAVIRRQEDYIIVDGLLYHIYVPPQVKSSKAVGQLVIPQDLKRRVLELHHDTPMGGHMGIHRMISVMRDRYFWNGITRDIYDYVNSCKSCNQAKPSNRSIRAPMSIRDPVDSPFHTIYIDTVGPLVRTPRGNKHIVVVTDQYSRFVFAWPTKDITARTVARELHRRVFCLVGAPKRIISDNGTTFTGEVFKQLCQEFKVKQCYSTSYHPQSQGLVERANRTLLNILRNFVASKQTDWDEYIDPVVFAMNSSECNALGYPAHLLVFGRNPLMPSEQQLDDPFNTSVTVKDHFVDTLQTQLECHNFARAKLIDSQNKMKARYDARINSPELAVGDVVYVYQPKLRVRNTKRKLQKSYHGPFLINDFRANNKAVVLKRVSDGKILEKSVSVDRLKKGHIRANTNAWDPIPENQIGQDDEELEESDLPEDSFALIHVPSPNDEAIDSSNLDATSNEAILQSDDNDVPCDDSSGIAEDSDDTITLFIGGDNSDSDEGLNLVDKSKGRVNLTDTKSSMTDQSLPFSNTPRISSRRTKGVIKKSDDFVY